MSEIRISTLGYTCGSCGHRGTNHPDPIAGWQQQVRPETAAALAPKFETVAGQEPLPFRTLFLSFLHRDGILDLLDDRAPTDLQLFTKHVAPELERIAQNFKIMGHLALPTQIGLAITDLSQPRAVFAFVVVEDAPDMVQKLTDLGMDKFLLEGHVGTINGQEWP